jgi:hypothetical protein
MEMGYLLEKVTKGDPAGGVFLFEVPGVFLFGDGGGIQLIIYTSFWQAQYGPIFKGFGRT